MCTTSPVCRIVDVGGGYGALLAAILDAHPGIEGVLFDMPHAIEGARVKLAEVGLAERCEFVAGTFFDSVPAGGDAYPLKSVIHSSEGRYPRLGRRPERRHPAQLSPRDRTGWKAGARRADHAGARGGIGAAPGDRART